MYNRIKIRVSIKRPKEFIKKVIQEGINLYDIKQDKKYIEIIIDKEDYEKIENIKTMKELKIVNYYGIDKIKIRIKRYKVLAISIIMGISLNIALSNIILQVEVKTPNPLLEKQVRKEAYSLGLKPFYLKKKQKNIEKIKKKLLQNDSVEWLEIEENGTKYIITIEEKKHTKIETCPNRNIIAKKKAIITKIESSSGEIIKKQNDYVEQGDIIISGTIHNKEEIVAKKCAQGKVLGETWYRVKVEIPQVLETKKKKKQYQWKIIIGKKNKYHDRWIIKKEYNIIESKIYPISISVLYLQKIEVKKKKYDINQIDELAYKKALVILKNHFNKKPSVIRKKVLKKELKNSKIIVDVFFALEEDITSYQLLPEENKEE